MQATILLEVTYKAPPGSISEKSIDRSEENKDVEGGRGENQEERYFRICPLENQAY